MSAISRSIAEKVAKAQVGGGGINIRHGKYLLLIKKMFVEKKHSGECMINEFVVLDAQKIEVNEGGVMKDVEPNKPGTDCSYVINFDGKGKDSAPGNAKQLLLALFSATADEMSNSDFADTFEDVVRQQDEKVKVKNDKGEEVEEIKEGNPMRGWVIRLSTYPKEIRSEKGRFITGMKWESASKPGEGENSPEKIDERRKMLDSIAAAAK